MAASDKPLRFGIVASETSGDRLGAGLIAALREHYPGAEFIGVGGRRMIDAGCQSLVPMDRLAVMGFVEPLGRLPELLRIKRLLEKTFIDNPPAAFIGIDSPDFNLRVAATLNRRGIPTVHYVSPSVWAYREKRIAGIGRAVNLMLTLFPFETEIYQANNIPVRCVGHPLADAIDFADRRAEHRELLGLAADDQVLTLMPGSRSGEIKRLGPDFIGAALEAQQYCPRLTFLIPCAGEEAKRSIRDQLAAANVFSSNHFRLVDDSHVAISAADLVLMASGTATLEAMLLRRPMIVCYRLAALTYLIASRMVKIPHVALPNLLAGRELVPEYLQGDVRVPVLRVEIVNFFRQPRDWQATLETFDALHRELRRDASAQAAAAVADLVAQRRGA